jgi:UDP-N-acetyl-2-amino-2-deoxyglucuronate dehydrogenase
MSALVEKRVAIVGLGRPAEHYLAALEDFHDVRLSAVVDPEAPSRGRLHNPALRAFRSVEELLEARAVPDVAVLCTPAPGRALHALDLLRAGADLIATAPLALREQEAELIAESSERLGRALLTAGPFRHCPVLRSVREQLASGRVGTPRRIECSLPPKEFARRGPLLGDGGNWLDLGVHALDLLEALGGPLDRIRIELRPSAGDTNDREVALLETQHESGCVGSIELGRGGALVPPLARCMGEEGEILVGMSQTLLRANGNVEILGQGHDPRAAHRGLFAEMFERRLSPIPDEDHGAQSVARLYRAYAARGQDGWQAV